MGAPADAPRPGIDGVDVSIGRVEVEGAVYHDRRCVLIGIEDRVGDAAGPDLRASARVEGIEHAGDRCGVDDTIGYRYCIDVACRVVIEALPSCLNGQV